MSLPRFHDEEAEQAFWQLHDRQMYVVRIGFLILSLFIYASLSILDLHVGGDAGPMMVTARAIFTILMTIGIVTFAAPGKTPKERENSIELCAFASISGQIVFIILAPDAATQHYQFGFGVVMSVGTLMLVPRFGTVARVLSIAITAYLVTIPWHQTDVVASMVSTLFNLLIAFAVLVGSFERERLHRLQAVTGQALARSNTDLKASRHDALLARDEAIAANKAKNVFLASVSHELRTPMNAIMGFSDMMRNEMFGPLGSPKYTEYVDHVHSSSLLLQANIDDLLDLARLETGKIGWADEVFPLDKALSSVLANCGGMAEKAGISLELENEAQGLQLEADPIRVAQAIINLTTNALKFSDPGGKVVIRVGPADDGEYIVRVVDDGCGMSREDLERVRQPFAQAHEDSYSKGKGGLGLGLAIVSGIVDTLGGRLDLESEEGEGTTATLVIPAHRVVATLSDAA